jgi:hypothetical protein
VERKRFLLNLRDLRSPSGFSIVEGKLFSKIISSSAEIELIFYFNLKFQVDINFATDH